MATWRSETQPPAGPIGFGGAIRAAVRGVSLIILIGVCLVIMLLLRLIEWPLFGIGRPITPHITQFVCRNGFRILGIPFRTIGKPLNGPGAVVANHSSWLDIFALNASKRIYFVAKSEVAGWPGIGQLAWATGTVFIKRDRREAVTQVKVFQDRLQAGHRLLFFPEGTSTDGLQVLPFKPTLFAAFFAPELRDTMAIQAATVHYQAPPGQDARFYGWWGDMALAPHLLSTLAARVQGQVTVVYHDPVHVRDFTDRKSLAKAMEDAVRSGLPD